MLSLFTKPTEMILYTSLTRDDPVVWSLIIALIKNKKNIT